MPPAEMGRIQCCARSGCLPPRLWFASVLCRTGAADTIKIGCIFPLAGNAASAGQSAKDAVEPAAAIVNDAHPELKATPLADTAGLPNLGGAQIDLIKADHQGNPSVGQNQMLRLITQDKVVAMIGSYHSSVTLTATAVSERYGIPYLGGSLGGT
jgi:branched-chain amino acid transport system substrate-binding protein